MMMATLSWCPIGLQMFPRLVGLAWLARGVVLKLTYEKGGGKRPIKYNWLWGLSRCQRWQPCYETLQCSYFT